MPRSIHPQVATQQQSIVEGDKKMLAMGMYFLNHVAFDTPTRIAELGSSAWPDPPDTPRRLLSDPRAKHRAANEPWSYGGCEFVNGVTLGHGVD